MIYFYSFMVIVFIITGAILFYNEAYFNMNRLSELKDTISTLKGKINCAKSDHDCDKAAQFKKEIFSIEEQYQSCVDEYEKIYKKYKFQHKIFSPISKKVSLKSPDELSI